MSNILKLQALVSNVIGDKVLAIDLYRQGIDELELGISIKIQGCGITGEALDRAERYLVILIQIFFPNCFPISRV